jgi:hypothetical protein
MRRKRKYNVKKQGAAINGSLNRQDFYFYTEKFF